MVLCWLHINCWYVHVQLPLPVGGNGKPYNEHRLKLNRFDFPIFSTAHQKEITFNNLIYVKYMSESKLMLVLYLSVGTYV